MKPTTHSFSHGAMTTIFEVIVADQEQEYARQASAAVFREIDRLEKLLNKYDPGSDIGQINLLKPGKSMRVAIETLECLEKAVWAHDVSGGLFDPTIGTGFQWLEIDRANFSVGWKKEGSGTLDLGGIGKGFAIDKAAELLKEWDIEKVLLNGGTSTVLGLGKTWSVGVGGSWGKKAGITTLPLKNLALSGSGTEVKGNHIINPKTKKPATQHLAAWAVHPSAAAADALSTAFMMMDAAKIKALCTSNPDTTAFVVGQNNLLKKIGV